MNQVEFKEVNSLILPHVSCPFSVLKKNISIDATEASIGHFEQIKISRGLSTLPEVGDILRVATCENAGKAFSATYDYNFRAGIYPEGTVKSLAVLLARDSRRKDVMDISTILHAPRSLTVYPREGNVYT